MGAFDDSRPEMNAEQFRLLRDLVHDYCGIHLREELKFVVERRLAPRLEALNLTDFGAYYRFLRYDPARRAELELAVEALTTHETYFFREPVQLGAFRDELLPRLKARNEASRRLRIWSAGCSSGEEPYTVAMLIRDSGLFSNWDVEITGTDIARRVLEMARRGEYGQNALRVTPPEMLQKHFDPVGTRWRVRDDIRALVSFGQLNLLEQDAGALLSRVDVVFCRNVMIYFDVPARKRVLKLFYDKLVPGGFLLLGHSENLLTLSADFELVHLATDLVYRRPDLGGVER